MPSDTATGPAFLRALDHVHPYPETDGEGWLAECPVWGCGDLLLIDPDGDHWTLRCDSGHTTGDVAHYLQCDTARDPGGATRKLWRAIMLSPRLEVCEALLRGQPVPRSALDPVWARRLGL